MYEEYSLRLVCSVKVGRTGLFLMVIPYAKEIKGRGISFKMI